MPRTMFITSPIVRHRRQSWIAQTGKRADIIAVITRALNMGGFVDAAHLLVGSALLDNVDTVVIDGRILKRAGKLTALPEAQVVTDARAALEGIRKRANWR
jgi:5-methylthioadenosine/S-adenosylhomocysteine deaminase